MREEQGRERAVGREGRREKGKAGQADRRSGEGGKEGRRERWGRDKRGSIGTERRGGKKKGRGMKNETRRAEYMYSMVDMLSQQH